MIAVTVTVYTVVVVGETVVIAVVTPELHAYVPTPVAVKVELVVVQLTVPGLADAVAAGCVLLTVTVTELVPVQPLAAVTVTVYAVVVVGETVVVAVVAPELQAYVPTPVAVSVD